MPLTVSEYAIVEPTWPAPMIVTLNANFCSSALLLCYSKSCMGIAPSCADGTSTKKNTSELQKKCKVENRRGGGVPQIIYASFL